MAARKATGKATRSGASKAARPQARGKAGRPSRQRHAQAHAAQRRKASRASVGKNSGKSSGKSGRKWSHHVMETSDAMDLQPDIFKTGNAEEIAQSLKQSSTRSRRRKGTPFQSAMSMLNFYINRAGRNLPKTRRATLEQAKRKLREAFGRAP
ncbi:hypothetical protein LMG22037_06382 [Paraburkholderia phenoliruptrix]|uniref:DUF3175 domain-containing protein n=1 Tax=Paraburkholderia phenoliruptrix TaxID=252970 RepID=A0A6J5CPB1_9BURK|nr:DUF3175 domain-containing protein [Paraburkholderia phenoliruptrix]CAB3740408.1 hypothetical protein LMG22037_06382 [Paraburkholderia phenoliruptrix]